MDPQPRGKAKSKWIWLAAVLVVAAFAAGFRLVYREGTAASPHDHGHREAIEEAHSPHQAALNAPEGATLCDTAFLSYDAFRHRIEEMGDEAPWKSFPDKALFLSTCGSYPEAVQRCLALKYQWAHWQECLTARNEFERARGTLPLHEIMAPRQ